MNTNIKINNDILSSIHDIKISTDIINNEVSLEEDNIINPKFLSSFGDIVVTNKKNPHIHIHQDNTVCFVTFRLNDSIPEEKYRRYFLAMSNNIKQNNFLMYDFGEITYNQNGYDEIFLDMGHGSCILKYPHIKEIVKDSLFYYNKVRYDLHSYVIMPNHVHILFSCRKGYYLQKIVHAWKSYTSHMINKKSSTSGAVWNYKYWDRLIRSEKHYVYVLKYIYNNNPKGAWFHPKILEKYSSVLNFEG